MTKRFPFASMAALLLLVMVIVSFLGQPFLPDNSENANRQHVQLPLLRSGASYDFLVISTSTSEDYIPVKDLQIRDGNYHAQQIINKKGETTDMTRKVSQEVSVVHKTFWLGTDILGRDLFSRLILGIKISLFIGFFAVVVSCIIGVFVGITAGYYGGWVDNILMTFINSMWSIPTILLVFALVLAIGRGVENIILAIGLTMWIDIARLVRGMTKSLKEKDYVLATKALSYGDWRVLSKHIFPNTIDPLIVQATANFATAILVEAGISYLGFGIRPPAPSVGILLSENYAYILGGHIIKSLAPAIVIIVMVLSLNIIGTALRDYLSVDMTKKPT